MARKRPAQRQVAALPWRKRQGNIEILLITSRRTRRWLIPKGWPMPPLRDFNAAKREALEEAGVAGRIRRKPAGRYAYDKRMANGVRRLVVTVYLLQVSGLRYNWPEKAERKRRWFKASEAALAVQEPMLRKIIAGLERT